MADLAVAKGLEVGVVMVGKREVEVVMAKGMMVKAGVVMAVVEKEKAEAGKVVVVMEEVEMVKAEAGMVVEETVKAEMVEAEMALEIKVEED